MIERGSLAGLLPGGTRRPAFCRLAVMTSRGSNGVLSVVGPSLFAPCPRLALPSSLECLLAAVAVIAPTSGKSSAGDTASASVVSSSTAA